MNRLHVWPITQGQLHAIPARKWLQWCVSSNCTELY